MVWALASSFPSLSLPWSAVGHSPRYRRSEVRWVNVHMDPTNPSPISDKQLGPGSLGAPWVDGGARQLFCTLASAADTLDSSGRKEERVGSI